jgi:hypothetical protein
MAGTIGAVGNGRQHADKPAVPGKVWAKSSNERAPARTCIVGDPARIRRDEKALSA